MTAPTGTAPLQRVAEWAERERNWKEADIRRQEEGRQGKETPNIGHAALEPVGENAKNEIVHCYSCDVFARTLRARPTREVTMATGKKAASDAGKILRDAKSTKKEKEVAASDLAQRKGATPTKPKKK
jgi:hypothetical protein